jgi:hypothetical protein
MTLHDTQPETAADAAPAAPTRPRTAGGNSLRPAMVVLGLAVLILGTFVTIGILTSQSPARVRTSGAPSALPGTTLRAVPAGPALAVIRAGGEPPTNVLNAVLVPAGSVRIAHRDNAGSAGQFDAQITMRSDDTQGALLAFFAADMKNEGWQVFDRGPAANDPRSTEVLGKLAGTDGYYWELGAVISPTTFGAAAPPTGQTDFVVRLYQVSDDGG